MSVSFSKKLLSRKALSQSEKMQVMQLRRRRLTEICKEALEAEGYELKGDRARSIIAERNGVRMRFGLKSSADRWVSVPENPRESSLARVDEIFVVAFDRWPTPKRIQIYRFKAGLIVHKAETLYEEARRCGYAGPQFLALDLAAEMDRQPTTFVSDDSHNLKAEGELFFDETIEWTDGAPPPAVAPVVAAPSSPRVVPATSAAPAVAQEVPIMEQIKGMLAEHLGVRPELIEIDVRVKI